MDILKALTESIINVFDEKGNKINFKTKEVKYYKSPYNSCNTYSRTLFIDDKPLLNNKKLKRRVEYRCECGGVSNILLCKFLEKEKLSCFNCKEKGEKAEKHKQYFMLKRQGFVVPKKVRKTNTYDFLAESDDFKTNYFSKHLKTNEFEKIKKYIYSIDGVVLVNKEYSFLEAIPSKNQLKYTQAIIVDNEVHKLKDIYIKCPLCGEIFHITRNLRERYDSNNFDCRNCYLTNKTFKIKKNHNGLTYQSNLELKFITKCFNDGIEILNGPTIDYIFQNVKRKYIIDFYLPKLHLLIEIKDSHVWHKRQVNSGKWCAKSLAAENYAKLNNLHFKVLFPKDIDNFFLTQKEIV